jgi:predicted NACHT family NTPase
MEQTNRYSLLRDALVQVPSKDSSRQLRSVTPELSDVLTKIGPLPGEALFLGMASDRLPVLLNLHDPQPGPILITGDGGSGKTAFLQMVAVAATKKFPTEELQLAVITPCPEEWSALEEMSNLVGAFAPGEQPTNDLLISMATWAHAEKATKQPILLMVDGLEAAAQMDPDTVSVFRWLLFRGPSRRVWPLVTMNADRYGQVMAWIEIFHTRVFGRIANQRVADSLGADQASAVDQLQPCQQYLIREYGSWLRFTIPGLG